MDGAEVFVWENLDGEILKDNSLKTHNKNWRCKL